MKFYLKTTYFRKICVVDLLSEFWLNLLLFGKLLENCWQRRVMQMSNAGVFPQHKRSTVIDRRGIWQTFCADFPAKEKQRKNKGKHLLIAPYFAGNFHRFLEILCKFCCAFKSNGISLMKSPGRTQPASLQFTLIHYRLEKSAEWKIDWSKPANFPIFSGTGNGYCSLFTNWKQYSQFDNTKPISFFHNF